MTGKLLRDVVNLLLYGGGFIGLCAACMTAFTFELTGVADQYLHYIILIGAATASLYSIHKVIGLQKTLRLSNTGRYAVIRQYQFHIRVYAVLWLLLTLWLFFPIARIDLMLWLAPGGLIAVLYVIPIFPGRKRLRDYGWGKIILLGLSWSWLTCIVPMGYFLEAPAVMVTLAGLQQMIFIMLLGIPFEIRDIDIDKSLNLITMPERLGKRKTLLVTILLIITSILITSYVAFYYGNLPYGLAMSICCLVTYPLTLISYRRDDDYFYTGLVDGMMMILLFLYVGLNAVL